MIYLWCKCTERPVDTQNLLKEAGLSGMLFRARCTCQLQHLFKLAGEIKHVHTSVDAAP